MLASDDADLQRLLIAVAAGDRAAFRTLYDAAAPKLFGIVLRIVKHRQIGEEVLQDVFLRVWRNASSFSPDVAPAWVWLNSIARNRSIDVLRQRNAVPLAATGDATDWFEKVPEGRDREGEMIENASLRRCLGGIEPQARDCVLLAYYEGFSREELAQRFGRPVNTIKTWLHRSLGALRDCLDEASS